jgi:hypothetical protein
LGEGVLAWKSVVRIVRELPIFRKRIIKHIEISARQLCIILISLDLHRRLELLRFMHHTWCLTELRLSVELLRKLLEFRLTAERVKVLLRYRLSEWLKGLRLLRLGERLCEGIK